MKAFTLWALVVLSLSPVYSQSVNWKANLDQSKIAPEQDQKLKLLIEINVDEIPAQVTKKQPINFGLVIDRSGSMIDQHKMQYAIQSSKEAVNAMTVEDLLSIVEYDDVVNVLWSTSKLENKQMILNKLDQLTPRNSTNLHGGLSEGIHQVAKGIAQEKVNRVLLLSDGLANRGITDQSVINELVQKARRKGITVSALGMGLDYNEDLMQSIASNGGGNYYFVESPGQLKGIFAQELNALYNTVCKGVTLEFIPEKYSQANNQSVKVIGYESEKKEKSFEISLATLYSKDKKQLLIEVPSGKLSTGKHSVGRLLFKGIYAETQKPFSYEQEVFVEVSSDQKAQVASVDKEIRSAALLIEVEEKEAEMIKDYESGRVELAKSKNQELQRQLKIQSADLQDVKLSKKAEALAIDESRMSQNWAMGSTMSKSFVKSKKASAYYGRKGSKSSYLLQNGSQGSRVSELQNHLKKLGYYTGPVDGNFNSDLEKAVKNFQKSKNLDEDGIAGPKVLNELGMF